MFTVVHYMNQFAAGFGSEDKADTPLGTFDGPRGSGVAFEQALAGKARIVKTIYAGDNWANEFPEEFLKQALEVLRQVLPDIILAGPAFNSGRYGLACGRLCKAAHDELGIDAVCGLGPENPGIEQYRKDCYIVQTGASALSMRQAIPAMSRLLLRLQSGEPLGNATEEGYMPRGFRRNVMTGRSSASRAVDMALARCNGSPWVTELPLVSFDRIEPPAPLKELAGATIALVTEGGVVPFGNPDHFETNNSTHWKAYSLRGDHMAQGEWEVRHGGYLTQSVTESPDRMVPYDAMVALKNEGYIGDVYPYELATTGSMTNVSTMQRFGREMGEYLRKEGVDAVLLTAT